MESKVQQALALLREAGRLDLVAPEALAQGHPVRRASAGVAAAVAACSPPRAAASGKMNAGRGRAVREAGLGAGRAARGRGGVSGRAREAPRASLEACLGQRARASGSTARRGPAWRRYGARSGASPSIRADPSKRQRGHCGAGRGGGSFQQGERWRESGTERPRTPFSGRGEGDIRAAGATAVQRDPLVPISKKWPTMLVWSSEDEDGALGGEDDLESVGEGPSTVERSGAPGRFPGSHSGGMAMEEEGSSEEGVVLCADGGRRQVMEGVGLPGTPDLFEQDPLDFEDEDPGEQGAALAPWDEEKASPRAASRMASTGRRSRRRRAADASARLCGSVGGTPPDAAAWEEQRLGPVRQWQYDGEAAGCAHCKGSGGRGWKKRLDDEDRMSEVTLEEGELRTSGSESEWWERQGRGVANPVRGLNAKHRLFVCVCNLKMEQMPEIMRH
ncbi:hypothetical protein NDU88_002791 [Pleurodeles waltl]|uniref:Uncharacterized protein n=1 Tax=Pleurodeles waltl TaxID=8319 RepID=A0AAV7T2X0_PLEWA|nr:hypothetical protein NDU88_002791 [Pleurodeles waltl]